MRSDETDNRIDDGEFLGWFDLTRPAMAGAQKLFSAGNPHAAALLAARQATEGPVRGVIQQRDIKATAELIQRHVPHAIQAELEAMRLWELPEVPSAQSLGAVQDARIGERARVGRLRGNDALAAALLFGTTGDRHFADLAIRWGLDGTRTIILSGNVDRPPAYQWHPYAGPATQSHDISHRLQYWMQVWAILHDALNDEDRLAWMKIIIAAARDRLNANRDEVAHNLTLHALVPSLLIATAFPSLKESADWLVRWRSIFLMRFCRPPFVTPDGYTREGCGYHNVNTRLLTLMHLEFARGLSEESPQLRAMCRGAYDIQSMFVCPDGSHWLMGDAYSRAHHEHWQDAHESLHLGAALFDQPQWKAAAGSPAGSTPELLNLWLMGPEGIERWRHMPAVDLLHRNRPSTVADSSGIAVLRSGCGVNAHAGMLCFTTEHNHAHQDKGQALIYGLGRHLISDAGFVGYGVADAEHFYGDKIHATASPIRRSPLGARTDHTDWAWLSGRFAGDGIEIAAGEHRFYENHRVRRALALAMPWGGDGPAVWLIWDRIDWMRPWPQGSPEPWDLIDTRFPLHAPGCGARISSDGRTVWSLYDGSADEPKSAEAISRQEHHVANELSDSDANIQITRLDYPRADGHDAPLGDVIVQPGRVCRPSPKPWPRPLAVFRWRGRMPHIAAYILVPFRGLRETPCARITGQASIDGAVARVQLAQGTAELKIEGLSTNQMQGSARNG